MALLYAYIVYNFVPMTLIISVVLPLILGTIILAQRKNRILLYSFLAYFFAVIDDAPVYFDSVLTWPEVTRFHPFWPRLLMNIVLHVLTLLFMCLGIRETWNDKSRSAFFRREVWSMKVLLLLAVAFVLAYAQNIPLAVVQEAVQSSWYQFDFAEKLASMVFYYLAVRESTKNSKMERSTETALV